MLNIFTGIKATCFFEGTTKIGLSKFDNFRFEKMGVRVSLTGLHKFDTFLGFEKANLRKHDCTVKTAIKRHFVRNSKIIFTNP